MEKKILLDSKYINIPVKIGKEEYITDFFIILKKMKKAIV